MDKPAVQRHPLNHPGSSQGERRLAALDPRSAPIDGRTLRELIDFCHGFSAHIRLPALDGRELSWQGFINLFQSRSEAELQAEAAQRPHAALFLTFLRLFRHAQADMDDLTRRHLKHYYEDILGLSPTPAQPDSVHLLMTLAKGHQQLRLPAGTALKSGDGLRYRTTDELFVDQATVNRLHSIFVDPQPPHRLRHALQADSADGQGAKLPKERPFWRGFGHRELPAMEVGFALASPLLLLREGVRTITASFQLQVPSSGNAPQGPDLSNSLAIYLSGEQDWLGPYSPSDLRLDTSSSPAQLSFKVRLDADQDPVTFFDPSKLVDGFDTMAPVMKVMLKSNGSTNPYHWLKSATLHTAKLQVHVTDMRDLVLENDLGRLDPGKPFLPFGPQPRVGSSLYVGSDETFSKNLTRFQLHLKWSGVQVANLKDHYAAYQTGKLSSKKPALKVGKLNNPKVPNNGYFTATLSLNQRGSEPVERTGVELFDARDARRDVRLDSDPEQIKAGLSHARMLQSYGRIRPQLQVRYRHSVLRLKQPLSPLFQPLTFLTSIQLANPFLTPLSKPPNRIRDMDRIGHIRLSLEKDFLHSVFPFYYAAVLADDSSQVIPNPPYTPTLESLRLEYQAQTRQVNPASSSAADYQRKELRLFHISPYGQREEHGYLRAQLGFAPRDGAQRLVPRFDDEGALLIGLSKLRPNTHLNLLLQVAEGTANPQRGRRHIRWDILVGNHWRQLKDQEIAADNSNSLLRSGIVRLLIPPEATRPSTWFDPSLLWLRASVDQHSDAVCELQGVHSQAVRAELADASANPAHLADALPANSLAKLEQGKAGIKQASQPYASFGGRPREADLAFYNRVSERLRHKQRAITQWDYERLLLEEFPQLHRVRCVNHSDPQSLEAPGHLTLVCIPQTHGRNSHDRLQPQVDLDSLSAIGDRLKSLTSPFTQVHVISPRYQPLRLELKIRLAKGLAFGAYQDILNQDLIGFLAPWTRTADSHPTFGASLHLSALAAYIDGLDYVDYIADLRIGLSDAQGGISAVELAEPSGPLAILTSHPAHQITEAQA